MKFGLFRDNLRHLIIIFLKLSHEYSFVIVNLESKVKALSTGNSICCCHGSSSDVEILWWFETIGESSYCRSKIEVLMMDERRIRFTNRDESTSWSHEALYTKSCNRQILFTNNESIINLRHCVAPENRQPKHQLTVNSR